jgi:hypothetical protein
MQEIKFHARNSRVRKLFSKNIVAIVDSLAVDVCRRERRNAQRAFDARAARAIVYANRVAQPVAGVMRYVSPRRFHTSRDGTSLASI